MYKLYQHTNSSGKVVIILAKVRPDNGRFMDGISLGTTYPDMYPIGYFSKKWGSRLFNSFNGVLELKSINNLFKSSDTNSIFIKSDECIWKISDGGLTKSDMDEKHLHRIERFRIKNLDM